MTSPTIAQVDAAVRAVLAGIRRAPAPGRRRPAGAFAGRLLGERQVEAIGPEVREIRVGPATVITPIARDLLKRRGIAVRLVSEPEASRRGEWGFAIEPGVAHADAIRRAIHSGPDAWAEVGGDAVEAAGWVSAGDDRGAVVLTPEASVACWVASRVPGVRPAAPADADAVARAVDRLGANLIVIEPGGRSIPSLLHGMKVFRRGGAPEVPGRPGGEGDDEDRGGDRPGDVFPAASFAAEPQAPGRRADAPGGDHRWLAGAWGGAGRVR
ncbi:hypothetical protein [Tautonia plasticadhaerens]|uniref:LUD domain-containing protein n=1 Tax=Tautonia plasticadhaerens TaxID=2527974 RepID=A0A518H7B7_9BACT|nr:hypothetical protein [Tautonia plasticadhaerens]QDV36656.1 hypothetical protein ElP_45850 [Tautonia plasticadhaerens]